MGGLTAKWKSTTRKIQHSPSSTVMQIGRIWSFSQQLRLFGRYHQLTDFSTLSLLVTLWNENTTTKSMDSEIVQPTRIAAGDINKYISAVRKEGEV